MPTLIPIRRMDEYQLLYEQVSETSQFLERLGTLSRFRETFPELSQHLVQHADALRDRLHQLCPDGRDG